MTVRLQCNDCKEAVRQGAVGETITQLRVRLGEVGWRADTARDMDLCPRCTATRLRSASQGGTAS